MCPSQKSLVKMFCLQFSEGRDPSVMVTTATNFDRQHFYNNVSGYHNDCRCSKHKLLSRKIDGIEMDLAESVSAKHV